MIINPNKINENLVVLMTIEIIAFLFFISSDSVSALLIWFLTISILNSIAVYLLIKHKPKYYKTSVTIMLSLLVFIILFIIISAIAFTQLYNHIESN
ncbi:hypothetical protein [Flavobacterium chungnamense]|jgi:hypothetical protein|uniref:Uncharacterized protein n=1 Tax=Flavobacterium chungnamense TaxID=706182 RepID=A0ABP7UHR1_9FLAO